MAPSTMFSHWFCCHSWSDQSPYLFLLSIWFTWRQLLMVPTQITQANRKPETDKPNQRMCVWLNQPFPPRLSCLPFRCCETPVVCFSYMQNTDGLKLVKQLSYVSAGKQDVWNVSNKINKKIEQMETPREVKNKSIFFKDAKISRFYTQNLSAAPPLWTTTQSQVAQRLKLFCTQG